MNRRGWIGSFLLFLSVAGVGLALAAWKQNSLEAADAASAHQPEPMETVTVAVSSEREYRGTMTSIGTVHALRSIALKNELAGTVREVAFAPGDVVEAGDLLVALDVSVEEAELAALEAQVALAETLLDRMQRASEKRGASEMDVDRARSERDVALANVARTKAIIARKTLRAPFRARVGMADVHPGQYLVEGTELTTLQGLDEAVHVDFAVPQAVASTLQPGDTVEVFVGDDAAPIPAQIAAVDARVDYATRNAWARALMQSSGEGPAPGSSVRVRVPVGPPRSVVVVNVAAVRKGPAGDHVFVIEPDAKGANRAHLRPVQSGALLGDEVVVYGGLAAGEQVAALGSFKLREGVLVAIADEGGASSTPTGGATPSEAPSGDTSTDDAATADAR